MCPDGSGPANASLLEAKDLQRLIDALRRRGYTVHGPTIRDQSMVYAPVESVADLPAGWIEEQDAGTCRLVKGGTKAFFAHVVGSHSWKQVLHPPQLGLWRAVRRGGGRQGNGFEIAKETREAPQQALLGVRACELSAIRIQDRVFLEGPYVDPHYKARREGLFIAAVNCTRAGGTCFCASMRTGPRVGAGYDLALTELAGDDRHVFVLEPGSPAGREVLGELPVTAASNAEIHAARTAVEAAAARMGRTLETEGLKELLQRNLEHPRWDAVAARCLACANCTMVCPTCFCTTVEEATDLSGQSAERVRKWDSCFSMEFSYIFGGHVRRTTRARYRQWMTHKLSNWHEQFGTSGCVGCGRCITWCPAGIDITEEATAIRGN